MKPLVVVEGERSAWDEAVGTVAQTWPVVRSFANDARVVCAAQVGTADDAGRAVIAALAGAGLVIWATADRSTIDRLCDDLRRFGSVDHRTAAEARRPPELTEEQNALLALLADGMTLGAAAAALHMSRRTADRRLGDARTALGVTSTTQAVLAAQRLRRA